MTIQENYQKAKKSGYSDKEILEYLSAKDPSFSSRIQKAKEAGYSTEEVLGYFNKPKENEFGARKHINEFGQQAVQGIGIGALGSYGDILDLFGLQSKKVLPGEEAQYELESKASPEQLPHLVETEDVMPRYSRLPTSKETEEFGKEIGLVSEPKTASGRYAKRIGKIGGASAVTGLPALKAPIAAGVVGQTLEEAGAPPWAQAAGEIIAFLKTSPKNISTISSESPEVQNVISKLRKSGFTEQDITLAKSSLEDRKILKPFARLTKQAEKSIDQAVNRSEELFKKQISTGLPGFEKGGMSALKNAADNLYKTMEKVASTVPINNTSPLQDSLQKTIGYLEKYAVGEDQKKTISYLKDALEKVKTANSADFLTDLYRGLNKEGKWLTPGQKEHVIRETKNAIGETFAKGGSESAKFGKYFDKTNESWKKWIDVQDSMELLNKAQKTEGLDWKSLSRITKEPENMELLARGLGKEQAQNIASIAEGVDAFKNIENLLKKSKNRNILEGLKLFEGIRSFFTGDYRVAASILGYDVIQRMATKMLVDPKYQNQIKKMIQTSKNQTGSSAALLAKNFINMVEQDKD